MCPSLSWLGQFEVMRRKLNDSITKLILMQINLFQAAIYYNARMIKSVHFGCGAVELNHRQEKELKRICKEPLLVKIELSRKFPRSILCSRKSALGIGILTPSAIMDMFKTKLFLGKLRTEGNEAKAVAAQEEYLALESGRDITISYNPLERC